MAEEGKENEDAFDGESVYWGQSSTSNLVMEMCHGALGS